MSFPVTIQCPFHNQSESYSTEWEDAYLNFKGEIKCPGGITLIIKLVNGAVEYQYQPQTLNNYPELYPVVEPNIYNVVANITPIIARWKSYNINHAIHDFRWTNPELNTDSSYIDLQADDIGFIEVKRMGYYQINVDVLEDDTDSPAMTLNKDGTPVVTSHGYEIGSRTWRHRFSRVELFEAAAKIQLTTVGRPYSDTNPKNYLTSSIEIRKLD
ncbi:MAG: hypothetical protein H8E48_05150 [Chloroflexi bacterium]|nr:hypothetical protein [Chloroflexota bacterium]